MPPRGKSSRRMRDESEELWSIIGVAVDIIILNAKANPGHSIDPDDVRAQLRAKPDSVPSETPRKHTRHLSHAVQPTLLTSQRHLHPLHRPYGLLLCQSSDQTALHRRPSTQPRTTSGSHLRRLGQRVVLLVTDGGSGTRGRRR